VSPRQFRNHFKCQWRENQALLFMILFSGRHPSDPPDPVVDWHRLISTIILPPSPSGLAPLLPIVIGHEIRSGAPGSIREQSQPDNGQCIRRGQPVPHNRIDIEITDIKSFPLGTAMKPRLNIFALIAVLSLAFAMNAQAKPAAAGAAVSMEADPHTDLQLEHSRAIGLLSNGQMHIFVRPDKASTRQDDGKECRLTISLDGQPVALALVPCKATFFPGGVLYALTTPQGLVEVMHLWTKTDPYALFVRTSGGLGAATVSCAGDFSIKPAPVSREAGRTVHAFSVNGTLAALGWDKARHAAEARHTEQGMVLRSPDLALDRAVALNQQLLDFAYNGNYLVCEIFRWTDIWSRDIGSGIIPGCLATGRYEEARKTLEEDLSRHDRASAGALKTTNDASKGGSAEGVSFLACAAWEDYLLTGDKEFLARTAKRLRPWVDAWLARDYAKTGLVTDVTDWMDHSRHLLLAYGARTLYANASMVRLLEVSARMEDELGEKDQAIRCRAARQRFIDAINRDLWSPDLGCYANLTLGGHRDERSDSGANALALLAGVADSARAKQVLDTLRQKNWRPKGSMTITPLMSHVDPQCDQNEKMWPWWMAYEARARFKYGDAAGGARLLHDCGVIAEAEKYPGLMKEIMDKDGRSEGGCAFVTGAGSVIATVTHGLFGVEILRPGMAEIKVLPCLPASWTDASLSMPTPHGRLDVIVENGRTHIRTTDNSIKVIHTRPDIDVDGAEKRVWQESVPETIAADRATPPPSLRARQGILLAEPGLPSKPCPAGLNVAKIDASGIATLKSDHALIISGNELPWATADGTPLIDLLDAFLGRGGQIVFLGASMSNREAGKPEKMGSTGGLISWYAKEKNNWLPYDSLKRKTVKAPIRTGTTYWGAGPYFQGWDLHRGLFGFSVEGKGVKPLASALPNCPPEHKDAPVMAVFTDFAVSSPWYFQPLILTHTSKNILLPELGEELPCAARLVNLKTNGEFILIGEGVTDAIPVKSLMDALNISL
jgi:hypothetical protein